MTRTLVIGDVHGCLDELDELVRAVEYRFGRDHLVFVGDLIDRGPDSRGVIRRAQELDAVVVLGNHEDKAARYHKHSLKAAANAKYVNPIALQQDWVDFTPSDYAYLAGLPRMVALFGDWRVIHAGTNPYLPFVDGEPDYFRFRYARRDNRKMERFVPGAVEPVPGTDYWADIWTGPERLIYGHEVFAEPHVTTVDGKVVAAGIDTGCVFGGKLTAVVLCPDRAEEFVSVPARRAYYSKGDAAVE